MVASSGAPSAGVASADGAHRRAMADADNWAIYGRDYGSQRWSPLDQITTANVKQLAPAWVFHSGIPHASESNPVVVDGTMYLSTALNHVVALDARTGARKWEYVHHYGTTVDCCAAINKGVAVYDGRVYMGTVDARLVSLDAKTGRKLWDVQVGDNEMGYHLTAAPLAVEGRVIVGVSGGEQGCRCYVDAYDAATGARLWRWYTIPSPADGGWWGHWREADEFGQSFHRDIAAEKADSAKYTDSWRHGGGPMWQHPSYDAATGLLIFGVGNPAPDNDASVRPGDNLYTDCIVALDARTGKLRWYYQEVSHDRWDYDPMSPPLLIGVKDSSGTVVPGVVEAGKDGFLYVLDRATGHPIRKSEPLTVLQNYMTTPTADGVIMNPATLGGNDWSPASYSPETGYVYVEENVLPQKYKRLPETFRPPAQWWGGVTIATPGGHYGFIEAVDPGTGRIVWRHRTDQPVIAGSIATAGGLVFTGTSDKKVLALDAKSGDVLWSAAAPAGVNAPPITYAVNGRQYVAVAATGIQTMNTPRGDALLAFALPDSAARGATPAPAAPAAPADSAGGHT